VKIFEIFDEALWLDWCGWQSVTREALRVAAAAAAEWDWERPSRSSSLALSVGRRGQEVTISTWPHVCKELYTCYASQVWTQNRRRHSSITTPGTAQLPPRRRGPAETSPLSKHSSAARDEFFNIYASYDMCSNEPCLVRVIFLAVTLLLQEFQRCFGLSRSFCIFLGLRGGECHEQRG
jgi:hypothetical protein